VNKAEVTDLLKKIKRKYPTFRLPLDDLVELRATVDEWHEDLENTPFDVAVRNLQKHSDSGEDWPPSIGKLKRPLQTESDVYHDFMKESAKSFIAEQESWKSTPPPEHIRNMMRLPEPERSEALREYARANRDRNASETAST
jgi:hypothetical protein